MEYIQAKVSPFRVEDLLVAEDPLGLTKGN